MSSFPTSSEFYGYEDSEDSGYDMSFKSETTEYESDYWCGTPEKPKIGQGFDRELYEKFNQAFQSSLEECNSDYPRCKTNLFGEDDATEGNFYTSTPVKKERRCSKDEGRTKRKYATGRNRVSRAKSPTQVSLSHF